MDNEAHGSYTLHAPSTDRPNQQRSNSNPRRDVAPLLAKSTTQHRYVRQMSISHDTLLNITLTIIRLPKDIMGAMNILEDAFFNLVVFCWDNTLFLLNLVTAKLEPDDVVPKGAPGYHGKWPEYVAPRDGDSRSACPMLNAMANHGILPHNGKNITFAELNSTVRQTFNFAPSFCFFVPKFAAGYLKKSYWRDRFDLAELSLHADNAIEHDASLTRKDFALEPDQGKIDQQLVDELLKEATGKMSNGSALLTIPDLSRALSKRRADARKTNKEYSESFFHNLFGSAKYVVTLALLFKLMDSCEIVLRPC